MMRKGPIGKSAPAELRNSAGLLPNVQLFRAICVFLALGVAILATEGALRVFAGHKLAIIQDERSLLYRYNPLLGWFPVPNGVSEFNASRHITVTNNGEGFRAPQHVPSTKPGIMFLGDSFVWGYDVQASERFTEKLQARHPGWSVYNLGVSGYGTDQEYLLLQKHFDAYKPKLVFLIYSIETDDEDNSTNVRYGGYYKPYCTVVSNELQLNGVPVPRSERVFFAEHRILSRSFVVRLLARAYFKLALPAVVHNPSPTGALIRTMKKFVESKGAVFAVGITGSSPQIAEYLNYYQVPFIDLSTTLRYPTYGWHWTPEGHSFVCDTLDEFLTARKYFDETRAKN